MSENSDDAYARAGVSYTVLDAGKREAQAAALRTAAQLTPRGLSELSETRGESAYVVDLGTHLLSTVSEGLGTKNLIADKVRAITGRSHYESIAQDTVATILNDLATVGGVPIALTAYWAAGSSEWFADAERMGDLVRGWEQACIRARCSWGGGETQTLVGVMAPDAATLGGSAVGMIAPRERLLRGARIVPGDVMLAARASGVHANGLTLIRKWISELPQGYRSKVPGDPQGRGVGEVLLDPTPLYGPIVESLQNAGVDLHYAVNVTGHGWRKIMRADQQLSYVIDRLPEVPPIFRALIQWAELDQEEAYGTFNMGAGFVLFVPEADVASAVLASEAVGFELERLGSVETGPRRVILRPLDCVFEGESLKIRGPAL